MSILTRLPQLVEDCRNLYELLRWDQNGKAGSGFLKVEEHLPKQSRSRGDMVDPAPDNNLFLGDNLDLIRALLSQEGLGEGTLAGKLQLIYIDPPFYSRADYGAEFKLASPHVDHIPGIRQKAYRDSWEHGMWEYLRMLTLRLMMMRDLLSDTGCLFVHLDWHVVHYVKVILDEIFGEKQFVNEIIWTYKSGGTSKRHFARKHDTILFYGKTSQYYFEARQEKSYNRGFKPYRFKGVSEYRDDQGWYTMVNQKDVWQIDMVGRTSAERTGYVTQKPEQLIQRILESCTRPGDLCADFFCGSGTLGAVAARMGRNFLLCDIGKLAVINSAKRLLSVGASFSQWEAEQDDTERDTKPQNGRLLLEWDLESEPMTGQQQLTLRVKGFAGADPGKFPVEEKYQAALSEILEKDPLQLLDYWSIDPEFDGKTHRPQVCYSKEKGKISTEDRRIRQDFEIISVRWVNIFGESGQEVIRPELHQKR